MGKIILQDSNQSILDAVSAALENEGYNVMPLNTTETILTEIALFRPDVVLLDFKMVGQDSSFRTCAMIKRKHPELPVLALSCNHHIAEEYSRHGFNGYIVKPFDIDHLYSMVELFSTPGLVYTR